MSDFPGHIKRIANIKFEDINQLLDELSKNDRLWDYWNALKPNKFSVFSDSTQHIVLKYPVDLRYPSPTVTFPLWKQWGSLIRPIIKQATCEYNYPSAGIARIMLAKLLPHSNIPLHIDGAPSAKLPHKIHVPLQTTPDVTMNFEEASYHLDVSSAYEVNNAVKHGVTNPSNQPRIHLIFDYYNKAGTAWK